MSMIETGIRALNAHELGLVSGAGDNNPFAGVKASAEGHTSVQDDSKECGWGAAAIIGFLIIFGV